MDWTSCKKTGFAKEIKTDKNLIEALLKSSLKKLTSQALLELNDDTASSKITLIYDALRELLEALATKNGFKIYNHECYTSFLSEIMNEKDISGKFDAYRKIRNDINYYGKDITKEEAREIIRGISALIQKIKQKYF